MILYRGIKPEMKYKETDIVHASATYSFTTFNLLDVGAGVSNRIGNKVKIWRAEVVGATSNSTPCRLDIVLLSDATTLTAYTYTTFVDPAEGTNFRTTYLHNGAHINNNGFHINHKFPMGIVSKYSGTATLPIDNRLMAIITQPIAGTVNGTLRIWYTDN